MTNQNKPRSCWTPLFIAIAIALITIGILYSTLDAQSEPVPLPTALPPVVIPTATMRPAPTYMPAPTVTPTATLIPMPRDARFRVLLPMVGGGE